jgi:hypothetical protein
MAVDRGDLDEELATVDDFFEAMDRHVGNQDEKARRVILRERSCWIKRKGNRKRTHMVRTTAVARWGPEKIRRCRFVNILSAFLPHLFHNR